MCGPKVRRMNDSINSTVVQVRPRTRTVSSYFKELSTSIFFYSWKIRMITLTIENSHLRRGLHGPHLSPESSNRRHIPCMGSRWKGEGERQYVDQVCTWPPCGTKSDTLLCFSFFFSFFYFFFPELPCRISYFLF